jgi:hypothetical protein
MQVGYSVNRRESDSSPMPSGSVLVDVPSIVNEAKIERIEQSARGSGYQLVGRTIRGDPIVLTVDGTNSMTTGIRVGTEKGKVLIRMRVNAVPPPSDPVIPTESEVNRWIPVKQMALPREIAGAMRFLARMSLPLALFGPAARKNLEEASGEKPDWTAALANLKRDSDKLRRALPPP